ncbi:hypothetical protein Taro_037526 [Colocasia esculenta]|uniref:Uncharacterized protein n=1 Tax=Colocasia esculenta TaxID=4460 RepID=A0A843W0S9_COLES|nr:hypothetical protein [Colocasia esculenta]
MDSHMADEQVVPMKYPEVSVHAGRCVSVASWVSAATVILVTTRVCVAFLSHPVSPSHLGVPTGQWVTTAFCLVGRLTPVRVAGVSVRPVALSRRPWRMRSCRGPLTRCVKVLNATGQSVASQGPKAKSLGRHPFPLSLLLPFSLSLWRCSASPSSPSLFCVFQARRRAVCGAVASWTLHGARRRWPTDVKGLIGVRSS